MNSVPINKRIGHTRLIPVAVIDDPARAAEAAKAVAAGGVDILEITLRTPAGLAAIEKAAAACPDMLIGAGTVLNLEACREALDRGARFIVSPGYDPALVEYCLKRGTPVFPGCVTPTEITAALNAGLETLKFFPANVYGGVKAIKALSGPFPGVQFIPTGGIDLSNLQEFLIPQVLAVGGGWLCDRKAVNAGDWSAITQACAQSRRLAAPGGP
ncbi:MAG: bifunctional 4-hydroxy-2-oxoglutarate aldolase/2-dehydro-3-deoxy-phosphogluconate aldolase [Spirochaetales bacterium]|jgi:2-dehydro-3-deoxyphosphogluconate aldolase/(4S)-4-hydroxy-2-oxoglutarate aldolase|nr:bifunctional 4-hydroxy-2-oxoglutarate aldolase/2-dehydro-3-deoxy-phosphogluconate aldolase [Spirochaetales bacterium]